MGDLARAMGLDMPKIYARQKKTKEHVNLDNAALAEKYCVALGLDFDAISLIKERLKANAATGHTPSTIIAGTIYTVGKERKLKLPIKKISQATSVSCISIQRFANVFSQRRKVSKR